MLGDIAQYGWHVIGITEDKGRPGWTFSIGMYKTFGHPEIIVFGLSTGLGHRVVNGIGEAIRAGQRFEAEQEYADILADVRCIFKPVQSHWYKWVLGYARWFYEGDDFPVVQCIWPDKQQNYPWQAKFKAEWAWSQPFLFYGDPVSARAVELIESMEDA